MIHVALIPDGNRRWAKKKNLLPFKGHFQGAKTTEKILKKVWELKIKYFTVWAGSLDNLIKRSQQEIQVLFKIYEQYFKKLFQEKIIDKEKVKVSVIGRWKEICPESLKRVIQKVVQKTKKYDRYFLTILLAYNGTDEMLDCVRKICKFSKNKKIDENLIRENLWTGFLPPVDLVIRTGCQSDPHNSAGFMMWHTAYSQFAFTKTLYPDFTPKEFEKIVKDFLTRERRLGK